MFAAIVVTSVCSLANANGVLAIEAFDSASTALVPCRVHLTDADGKPVKPDGFPSWHDHFLIDGRAEITLPPGLYRYAIERGPEFRPVAGEVAVFDQKPSRLRVEFERLIDMSARGWWPGDLHVHRPIEHIELLMRAEDLHVAPVITWWNTRNQWKDRALPAATTVQFDDDRFYDVMAGEDERNGGAFLIFGRAQPLEFSGYDKEWPFALANVAFAENVWLDIEKPFWWDVPAALATGSCDSIGIANNHMCRSSMYASEAWGRPRDVARLPAPRGNGYWSQEIYYDILECGIRLPPSAGSASGVLPNPVGYNRVYVHLDGPLTWHTWWEGLRAGRSFVTNGPMLIITANGELPGHVFRSKKPIDIDLTAEFHTLDTVPWFEVVHDGQVVRRVPYAEWIATKSLGTVRFDRSGWLLVRAIADNAKTFRFASSAPFYVEVGRNPTRVSRSAAQRFLDWERERVEKIQHTDSVKYEEILAHHRRALVFWERKVREATED